MFVVQVRIIGHGDTLPGHHTLIEIDYLVAVIIQLFHTLLQTLTPHLIFFFFFGFEVLREFDSLSLDLVQAVHLPQQSRVYSAVAKVPMEEHTPLFEGDTAP